MTGLEDLLGDLVADVDAVMLFTQGTSVPEGIEELETPLVVVGQDDSIDAGDYVELPLKFTDLDGRIRFGLEGALQKDFLEEGDDVVCLTQSFDDDTVDTVVRVRADEFTHSGVYDLFVNSRADADVVRDVFEVAIELGKKGQKGKRVGALFVVGDAGKVMNKSRPLSYNPFEKSHVQVGDPIVNVMLKEFSRLDGAFVISDGGKIVSAALVNRHT